MKLLLAVFLILGTLTQVAHLASFVVDPVNGPYYTILSAVVARPVDDPVLELTLTAGTHSLAATIELIDASGPTERFSIVGAGPSNTFITRAAAGTRAFYLASIDEIIFSGVTIQGCVDTDSDNAASGGGAMLISVKNNLTIENSVLSNNRGKKGGALSIVGTGQVFIRQVGFFYNTVNWSGGAIFTTAVDILYDTVVFDGNSAPGEGGAIQIYSESGEPFTHSFVNSVLANNNGGNCGGAISTYSDIAGQINLSFESCVVRNNTIVGGDFAYGGAVCAQRSGNFYSYNTTWTQNNVFKGAVSWSYGGAVNIWNNQNQGTTTILSSRFSNNFGRVGGALFVSNRYAALHTQAALIQDTEFDGNSADAGAVMMFIFTTASLVKNNVHSNTIESSHAAIEVTEGGVIYLNNTVVTNTTNAGGVYCESSTVNWFQSSIYGNGALKDITCSACTWNGMDFYPCSQTCDNRDVCSNCNGNTTCTADCVTNSVPWNDVPCAVSTTGSTTGAGGSSTTGAGGSSTTGAGGSGSTTGQSTTGEQGGGGSTTGSESPSSTTGQSNVSTTGLESTTGETATGGEESTAYLVTFNFVLVISLMLWAIVM